MVYPLISTILFIVPPFLVSSLVYLLVQSLPLILVHYNLHKSLLCVLLTLPLHLRSKERVNIPACVLSTVASSYLVLVDESFREEDTAGVDKGSFSTKLHKLGVSLVEKLHEDPVNQVLDHHCVLFPPAAKKTRVGQLVQHAGLAPTALVPLLLVQEQVVTPRLDHPLHHLLHVLHGQG